MSKKKHEKARPTVISGEFPGGEDIIEPHPMTGNARLGMIVGAVVGAIYGLAYATIPKIVKLDVGPVPGPVVGVFFGAGFGLCFGGYMGGIGKDMLKPKALLGFAGGFLIMLIGRLADDTGGAVDKIMDIVVGGTFWGCIGAIAGALGVFDEKNSHSAPSTPSSATTEPVPETAAVASPDSAEQPESQSAPRT